MVLSDGMGRLACLIISIKYPVILAVRNQEIDSIHKTIFYRHHGLFGPDSSRDRPSNVSYALIRYSKEDREMTALRMAG